MKLILSGIRKKIFVFLLLTTALISSFLQGGNSTALAIANTQNPTLSTERFGVYRTAYNLKPPVILRADKNPQMQGLRNPSLPKLATLNTGAVFEITYAGAGDLDPARAFCKTFPPEAQAAFSEAANIWASTIQSDVPITLRACWASLDQGTLGYSGYSPYHINPPGGLQPNVWYQGALANALAGEDLAPTEFDMHLTFNADFNWYFGTDGNTPTNQYDLMTVVLHEIAHGLHFGGSAYTNGITGQIGYESEGYIPEIYDMFMEDASGTRLVDYQNPSSSLSTVLLSNNLWWGGSNAKLANQGVRVKMYAPSGWQSGSSYSHLDYDTFAGTSNSLMVYALGEGSSQHNPGPVTACLLKDMGWSLISDSACITTFSDVSTDYWAWEYIERLYTAGLTDGYPDGTYRPSNTVTRAEMAIFLLKGINGSAYIPPVVNPTFSDTSGHWAKDWIEALKTAGLTGGYPDGTYRPNNPVTRAEMAIFLLKAMNGSSYNPPIASPTFSDTSGHWAVNWIEALKVAGITSGYPDGTYRPGNYVTRAEMAVFLVRTFALP